MKKLFFTAIALVAFSGISMANTVEFEEQIIRVRCIDVYNETYMEFVSLGLESEAASEAWAAYKECKGN